MIYVLETVGLVKIQVGELEVAELRMLKFVLGVTSIGRISNEHVMGIAKVRRLDDKLREVRLRWYRHVMRREE